jgi:hypothetical protein
MSRTEAIPEKHVWIFARDARSAPGGVFTTREAAELWIREHHLTGVLTALPLDEGCYDWAMRLKLVTGCATERGGESAFVASFSSAAQEHHHYTDGELR